MTKHAWRIASSPRLLLRTSSFGFLSDFVIRVSSFIQQKCQDASGDKNVYQRNFKKEKPAQAHELIVTETRQGPAHPHEKKQKPGHFCEKDGDVDQAEKPSVRAIWDSWKMPAAKEQRYENRRPSKQGGVFA